MQQLQDAASSEAAAHAEQSADSKARIEELDEHLSSSQRRCNDLSCQLASADAQRVQLQESLSEAQAQVCPCGYGYVIIHTYIHTGVSHECRVHTSPRATPKSHCVRLLYRTVAKLPACYNAVAVQLDELAVARNEAQAEADMYKKRFIQERDNRRKLHDAIQVLCCSRTSEHAAVTVSFAAPTC